MHLQIGGFLVRKFDFYEFVGIIVPGMLVLVGGMIIVVPNFEEMKKLADLSVGGLGIGILVAYVAGQLVQTVGNGIEKVWWRIRGGMPTDLVRTGKRNLIADAQRKLLQDKVRQMLENNAFVLNAILPEKQWYSITRQIYAAVDADKRAARVDIFNGNYGLHRGIASGLLVLMVTVAFVDWQAWRVESFLLILFAFAIYRMNRFAVHYGRELFVQFLEIDTTKKNEEEDGQ